MNKEILIGKRRISEEEPVYIIAEMSANHLGDIERAKTIIRLAREAGADAVKLQTYTPDTITLDSHSEDFKTGEDGLWKGMTLYELYESAYMPWEWQPELKRYADGLGITCFSSPFDFTAVDFMEEIKMPAIKIASYEMTDLPLIRYGAKTGKPLILSTGIAYLADIEAALRICREERNENVILLKCVSAYPCPYEEMSLRQIPRLAELFGCLTGLSDHSMGSEVALGAVALGARVIEKHVTLKRGDGGADAGFSMEMEEFADMARQIRNLEKALGNGRYELTEKQVQERSRARSLYIVKEVKKGEKITKDNIRSVRPGTGLSTAYYEKVLGKCFMRDAAAGTPLAFEYIEF